MRALSVGRLAAFLWRYDGPCISAVPSFPCVTIRSIGSLGSVTRSSALNDEVLMLHVSIIQILYTMKQDDLAFFRLMMLNNPFRVKFPPRVSMPMHGVSPMAPRCTKEIIKVQSGEADTARLSNSLIGIVECAWVWHVWTSASCLLVLLQLHLVRFTGHVLHP